MGIEPTTYSLGSTLCLRMLMHLAEKLWNSTLSQFNGIGACCKTEITNAARIRTCPPEDNQF
jgi:hypothetical protein